MKKKSTNVDQKVIIIHEGGVSDQIKQKIQSQYPNALVKPVKASEVATEAIQFGKRVNVVVCMPEVKSQGPAAAACWEGCTLVNYKT